MVRVLSTPFILPTLTEAGHMDVAFKMLENEDLPSWLAQVKAGATTVWEDWEGKASHNHYSPGLCANGYSIQWRVYVWMV